jgi:hypothetical protein
VGNVRRTYLSSHSQQSFTLHTVVTYLEAVVSPRNEGRLCGT